jgi:hypothetical protein
MKSVTQKLKEMLATNCLRWRSTGEEKVLCEKSSLLLFRLTDLAYQNRHAPEFQVETGAATLPPRANPLGC